MNKKQDNIRKIHRILEDRGYISTTELGERLGMTTVSAFYYLRDLVKQNIVERIGKGKKTRYGLRTYENKHIDTTIIDDTAKLLLESGFDDNAIITNQGIRNLLNKHFAFVSPTGVFTQGFEGFIAWCLDNKRRYTDRDIQISKLVFWLTRYYELSLFRRKHGFFDGTASLQEVFRNFKTLMSTIITDNVRKNTTEIFIDTLLFHEIVEIAEFGKTKTALELYFGKENRDR